MCIYKGDQINGLNNQWSDTSIGILTSQWPKEISINQFIDQCNHKNTIQSLLRPASSY